MNPELSLCEHLVSPGLSALPVDAPDVLEWCEGPVTAVIRCPRCGSSGLIAMLAWDPHGVVRVFGMAALETRAFEIFQRNRSRGSCDAARPDQEVHALLSSAGPAEVLLALDVRADEVRAVAPYPGHGALPTEPWERRLPADGDDTWFRHVGLGRSAAPASESIGGASSPGGARRTGGAAR